MTDPVARPAWMDEEERRIAERKREAAKRAAALEFPNPAGGTCPVLLILTGAISALLGFATIGSVTSAICFLITAVCLGAVGIITSVSKAATSIRSEIRNSGGADLLARIETNTRFAAVASQRPSAPVE